jgi:hypothetical protein
VSGNLVGEDRGDEIIPALGLLHGEIGAGGEIRIGLYPAAYLRMTAHHDYQRPSVRMLSTGRRG